MKNKNKLFLFNSFSGIKEEFIPINKDKVLMYVCGPTLYDSPHIGNARPLIVFDVLFRLLKTIYKNVIYVRNITDVDDKIINKAIIENKSAEEIVSNNLAIFKENLLSLNILQPTKEPFATKHIKDMISIIQNLIQKDYAYIKEGNVFFNTSKFKSYGSLSKRTEENNIAGMGNDSVVKDLKHNAKDFVLWKPVVDNSVCWDSPFGNGRPGWHIECSAMAYKYLGEKFDIHGGGIDLLFPHHENERAQTMAAFGCSCMAHTWVHNGFINIDNSKMSKSIGNVVTISNVLENYNGEVLRLAILLTHYRSNINFTEEVLLNAKAILDKMYNALILAKENNEESLKEEQNLNNLANIEKRFKEALLDDLNTPLAITEMQKVITYLNKSNSVEKPKVTKTLIEMANLLGILQQDSNKWFSNNLSITENDIQNLINKRDEAKKNKDYKTADKIRQNLLENNILLEDTKNGTKWRKI